MEIKQPAAHLDQMIRQTRAHHVSLSTMADRKANMMLTLASLMIPLSIKFLYDERSHLAAAILIGFCVLTILLAAFAAMPKIKTDNKTESKLDINAMSFNLLFFGSFAQMTYDEYKNAMETMMNDPNAVYETQLREIYTMGQYLAEKKYRFVQYSYLSFIAGVLVSSMVYVIGSYI
jgi:hypothetical protein